MVGSLVIRSSSSQFCLASYLGNQAEIINTCSAPLGSTLVNDIGVVLKKHHDTYFHGDVKIFVYDFDDIHLSSYKNV